MPEPPTPSPGRNAPQRRIGSAISAGSLRKVMVSTELSDISSRRCGILHLVADAGEGEVLAGRAVLAALEAHHLQAGLGELARDDRAGPAHADHHRIDFFQSRDHDSVPPYEKSAIDCGAAT